MRARFVNEAQNFQRGQTPKKSIGIGLKEIINKWLEDELDTSLEGDPSWAIEHILENDLDNNTKKTWIEYLISINHDDNNWDENDYESFKSYDIKPLSAISNGYKKEFDGIYISKNNDRWQVAFSDDSEFINFYKEGDWSKDAMEKLLEGDAYNIFFVGPVDFPYDDAKRFIIDNENTIDKVSIETIKNIYVSLGGDESDNLNQILDNIEDDENYGRLKFSILLAITEADANAREGRAFQAIRESINDFCEINVEFSQKAQRYEGTISEEGVRKLMEFHYMEEEGWEAPYSHDDYSGDIDINSLGEYLQNELENEFTV